MKFYQQKNSRILFLLTVTLILFSNTSFAQDKLKKMPGYDRFIEMMPKIRQSIKRVPNTFEWNKESTSFIYNYDGKTYEFDTKTNKAEETEKTLEQNNRRRGNYPKRGRQFESAVSPDGKLKAFTKDRNMYISNADDTEAYAITTEGNDENQIKYGIATWVYGEELGQITAMWWSPDSKKIAFYRFDEKQAKKYYVLYNQTMIQDSVEIEAYPKVGAKNLPVDLLVYDLETKQTITLDSRNGKPYHDGDIGTYLYDIEWSPDGTELLFHSTNRKQDIMEFKAADPVTGKTRVIVREEWPASYTENSPEIRFLKDGKRFIWASERTGFKNYYLYDISGKLINAVTKHKFEVAGILHVDEENNCMYYMARSGENHMKMQLHKVKLDGKKDVRLTDPKFNHRITISPDRKYFIDYAETHNTPPFVNLYNIKGKKVSEIAKSDLKQFKELGLKPVEVFTFTSADGVTELHGMLHFPSTFDPSKKYPVILSIYGGPNTNGFRENFAYPSFITEFGFLVVNLDGRNVGGRGKKLSDQLYGNLGIVEMDDFAEGIKSLYDRPYVDKENVGVFGTSYGGFTSAALILRYPDIFHAAAANSAVTDWRNYDNIYTERFMNLLENNKEGYNASNLMQYVGNLKGELMIYFGTSDNNVHPSNSLQLIDALQNEGKSFEVQIGPDRGHTMMNYERMMEFFIQHLVLN